MQENSETCPMTSLGEWLETDTNGDLAFEILQKLLSINQRLENEKIKLQSPENYETIMAGLQAVENAELVMKLYLASKNIHF